MVNWNEHICIIQSDNASSPHSTTAAKWIFDGDIGQIYSLSSNSCMQSILTQFGHLLNFDSSVVLMLMLLLYPTHHHDRAIEISEIALSACILTLAKDRLASSYYKMCIWCTQLMFSKQILRNRSRSNLNNRFRTANTSPVIRHRLHRKGTLLIGLLRFNSVCASSI